jgi:hypothetical protein
MSLTNAPSVTINALLLLPWLELLPTLKVLVIVKLAELETITVLP